MIRNILYIDDNPNDIRLIQDMIGQHNLHSDDMDAFHFLGASSLKDGFDLAGRQNIDLILLDLFLAETKGIDTFRRCLEHASDIPIIVLTGLEDEMLAVQAVREGAQDYLTKNHVDSFGLNRSIRYAIERKALSVEKDKLRAQLLQSQKMEAIGRLAGGVAHDFNNLMTAVQGFTDVLMMRTEHGHPNYRALEQIRIASSRAADLTRKMLMFSRRHMSKFEPVEINAVIEDLLKMLTRVIGEDIEIGTQLSKDLPKINGDKGSIEQLILNLAVNAKEAMPDGGSLYMTTEQTDIKNVSQKEPEIEPGTYVKITVEDNGSGISKEDLAHIFDPFFSTKNIALSSGLGLSVAYGIIRQHKGWIDVQSEVGQGTTFQLYFPVIAETSEKREEAPVDLESLKGKGRRILLVEDSEGVREFATMALEENDYEVYAVTTSGEALEVMSNHHGKIDIVLTDVVLPDKSGIQLVEELLEKNPSLKILLSSGYTDQKSQWPVIQEKGYPFLQKPYSLTELIQTVHRLLEEPGK